MLSEMFEKQMLPFKQCFRGNYCPFSNVSEDENTTDDDDDDDGDDDDVEEVLTLILVVNMTRPDVNKRKAR